MPVKSRAFAVVAALVGAAAIARAGSPRADHQIELKSRLNAAERAVVGHVARAVSYMKHTEYGDTLIMSHVELAVEETLKGPAGATLPVEMEGGTLNGITMRVSDMPALSPGTRAVVMVTRGRSGELVPAKRGDSVLELEADDHIKNSDLWLDDVRQAAGSR
jgi:hypothetical protein